MKLPNWMKIILWGCLTTFVAVILFNRLDDIIRGWADTSDIAILLIFIALLAAPLFQEVDFFGVKLKREIDNLRTDFKEQIINLRSDIQNTINMRTEISPQIILTPPTDYDLERMRPVLEQFFKEQGIKKPASVVEPEIPDDTRFLFSVRYAIENELRRIVKRLWVPPEERRFRTTLQIVHSLSQSGTILPVSVDIIRDVLAICSSAIHGEDVSKGSVKFVRDASPVLLKYLKAIEEQPPTWVRPGNPQWIPKDNPEWKPKE